MQTIRIVTREFFQDITEDILNKGKLIIKGGCYHVINEFGDDITSSILFAIDEA